MPKFIQIAPTFSFVRWAWSYLVLSAFPVAEQATGWSGWVMRPTGLILAYLVFAVHYSEVPIPTLRERCRWCCEDWRDAKR